MAKSKLSEKYNLLFEGLLNIEDMTLEIEDIGTKKLSEILKKFDGCIIKGNLSLGNDLD